MNQPVKNKKNVRIKVREEEKGNGRKIEINGPEFSFTVSLSKDANETLKQRWSKELVLGAVLKYLSKGHPSDIHRSSKKSASLVYRILRYASYKNKGALDEMESVGKAYQLDNNSPSGVDNDSQIEEVRREIQSIAGPIPPESIFKPEETGVTYAMIGKSFSGKTTFVVNELNKLTEDQLKQYNAIVFFTESSHALPLKKLADHVKPKVILIDRFCPKVLMALKKINDHTKNMFKFLVIFDDIIALRGPLLTKCILTLRNANISTVISIQYEKLLNPAQRSSVHNMFIFNLRSESWEFLLKGYLLGNVKETLRSLYDVKSVVRVSQLLRETMDPFILYYNQREDLVEIWNKKSSN
jgi:hypothetical protein